MLTNKTIILGITGSIAAYKAADIASKLTQAGAKVEVVMTEPSTKFITPLTLRATKEALRRNRVAAAVEDKDLVELAFMSADFKEGMEAFLAKRKPHWQGK